MLHIGDYEGFYFVLRQSVLQTVKWLTIGRREKMKLSENVQGINRV